MDELFHHHGYYGPGVDNNENGSDSGDEVPWMEGEEAHAEPTVSCCEDVRQQDSASNVDVDDILLDNTPLSLYLSELGFDHSRVPSSELDALQYPPKRVLQKDADTASQSHSWLVRPTSWGEWIAAVTTCGWLLVGGEQMLLDDLRALSLKGLRCGMLSEGEHAELHYALRRVASFHMNAALRSFLLICTFLFSMALAIVYSIRSNDLEYTWLFLVILWMLLSFIVPYVTVKLYFNRMDRVLTALSQFDLCLHRLLKHVIERKQVELVAHGFHLSSIITPIARLERKNDALHCMELRHCAHSALLEVLFSLRNAIESIPPPSLADGNEALQTIDSTLAELHNTDNTDDSVTVTNLKTLRRLLSRSSARWLRLEMEQCAHEASSSCVWILPVCLVKKMYVMIRLLSSVECHLPRLHVVNAVRQSSTRNEHIKQAQDRTSDNDEFVRALDKLDHTCSEIRALMCIAREEMAKLSSVPRENRSLSCVPHYEKINSLLEALPHQWLKWNSSLVRTADECSSSVVTTSSVMPYSVSGGKTENWRDQEAKSRLGAPSVQSSYGYRQSSPMRRRRSYFASLSPPPAPESVSGGVPPPPPPIHDGMWDFEKKLARPSTRAERLAEKAATTTAGEEWEGESSVFALEERPMARESSKPPMEVLSELSSVLEALMASQPDRYKDLLSDDED